MKKNLYINLSTADRVDYFLQDDKGEVLLSGSAFHHDQLPEFPEDAKVSLIVPGTDVLLLSLTLPKMSRHQLLKAIPYALEEQLIEDVEQLHFAPSKQQTDGSFYVAIVKKELMQQWCERCLALGVVPQIAVPDYLAIPALEQQWHLYLHDQNAILRQNKLQGLTIEQTKLKEMLQLCLSEQVDTLPTNIMIDYDDGNEHFSSESLGQLPVAIELAAADQFAMEMFAQGLKHPSNINLLQGEYIITKPKNKNLRLWKWVGIVLVAWFIIWLVGGVTQYFIYHTRLTKAQTQVKQLYQQAFPQAKSLVEPRLRIQRALQSAQNAGAGGTFLKLLTKTGESLSKQAANITIENFSYRNKTLTMSLSANSFQAFSVLVQLLKQQGLTVKQQNSSTQGKKVTTRLTIKG